jgi:hypothetical protein
VYVTLRNCFSPNKQRQKQRDSNGTRQRALVGVVDTAVPYSTVSTRHPTEKRKEGKQHKKTVFGSQLKHTKMIVGKQTRKKRNKQEEPDLST